MKAYINRKIVQGPWGGGNLWLKAANSFLPDEGFKFIDINKETPDVIFVAGLSRDQDCPGIFEIISYKNWYKKYAGKDIKVILRVNECDAGKGTSNIDSTVREVSRHVDHVVFVSEWLMNYFSTNSWNTSTSFIRNGVDSSIFKPREKLNNGKINIVTHHWSDNNLKGLDVYEKLDRWIEKNKDFNFTYIGRHKSSNFKNTKHINPLFGEDLGKELSKHDVYVSASRFEAGPNHVIESLSCNIPVFVHRDGGACIEFAGKDHIYNDTEELFEILKRKNYSKNTVWLPDSWNNCIKSFSEVAKGLL